MNLVDLVVLVAAVGYALTGWRNGALAGLFSIGGFVAGAVIGAQLAHPISAALVGGDGQVVLSLVVLIAVALLGQALGAFVAARLRAQLIWRPARTVDSSLGAVLSVAGVLLVAWMVALPLASVPVPALAREIRESRVIHGVDDVMPAPVRQVYSSLRDSIVEQSGFPAVFGALSPSRILTVPAPNSALGRSAAVARDRESVVKITAHSDSCDRGVEGSGFVYAAGRVMTNAHVVAGMNSVTVRSGSVDRRARVVVFDPDRDVAVLAVTGLAGQPLRFDPAVAASGTDAIVLGFPQDGPFDVEPARIRERERISGRNIYGRNRADGRGFVREIYAVRALVRPGNSGGPLLGRDGKVLGVVFAAALDSSDTGYALTAAEVAPDAATGRRATTAVGTGACT